VKRATTPLIIAALLSALCGLFLLAGSWMAFKDTVTWAWSPPEDLTPIQRMQDIRFTVLLIGAQISFTLMLIAIGLTNFIEKVSQKSP